MIWWAWAIVVVLSLGDLAVQGHDLSALRFALGLLTVTGLVYACTLWPRVIAGEDGLVVQNPFRCFDIPWRAVKEVSVADSVRFRCVRMPPRKDKTIYSWALSSSRRANARAEMRARQWERRGGRSRPRGWDQMPAPARELAKMTQAEVIASELASVVRQARAEPPGQAPPEDEAQAQAQAEDEAQAQAEAVVMSVRWAWPPLAALLVPGVAFAIAMLVR